MMATATDYQENPVDIVAGILKKPDQWTFYSASAKRYLKPSIFELTVAGQKDKNDRAMTPLIILGMKKTGQFDMLFNRAVTFYLFSEEQRAECKNLEMTPHDYLKMLACKAADDMAAALMEEEIPANAKGLSVEKKKEKKVSFKAGV